MSFPQLRIIGKAALTKAALDDPKKSSGKESPQ